MKKNKCFLILLCAVLALGIFGLSGCSGDAEDPGAQNGSEEPAEQTYRVALFFANEKYIATGDESQEKFMVYEVEMTSKPGDAYKNALELLRTAPEDGYSTVIKDQIKFNDVYPDGNTVMVDLSSDGLNGFPG